MIQIRLSTEVQEDRQVTLKLPDDVPTGIVDLLVTIDTESEKKEKSPRTSLAEWAEQQSEHWGEEIRSTDVEGFTGRGNKRGFCLE